MYRKDGLFPADTTFTRQFIKELRGNDGGRLRLSYEPPKGREFVLMCLGDVPEGLQRADGEKMLNELGFFRVAPDSRVVCVEELELLTTAVQQGDRAAALEILERLSAGSPAETSDD